MVPAAARCLRRCSTQGSSRAAVNPIERQLPDEGQQLREAADVIVDAALVRVLGDEVRRRLLERSLRPDTINPCLTGFLDDPG
jgi:hypothetical protein